MSTQYPHLEQGQPWISINVAEDGRLSVRMFGIDRDIPPELGHRDRMGQLMDYLYDLFAQPFSAEIIEADGQVNRGVIDQRNKPAARGLHEWAAATQPQPDGITFSEVDPAWGPPDETPAPRHQAPPGEDNSVEVRLVVGGFLPGEQLCLAYTAGNTVATELGEAVVVLPREWLESLPTGEVILIGRASRTVAARLPLAVR